MIARKIKNRLNALHYKTDIGQWSKGLESIHTANLNLLNAQPSFIRENDMQKAKYKYGIPDHYFTSDGNLIDLPINDEITYTDLICKFCRETNQVNYLEIGVSVGKNMVQIMQHLKGAQITGLDIEEIPSAVLEKLDPAAVQQKNQITNARVGNNEFSYICGSVLEDSTWKSLEGRKYNILLSDALHTPEAIWTEYLMMKKYQVIDPKEFVIFWDDLGGEMTDVFISIFKDMKKNGMAKKGQCAILSLNGWIGQHEKKHNIGIISNRI